jgi:hypothetical protein
MKSVAHLVEAQAPLNWRQLGRLGLALRPIDSLGKYDERGNEYELGNELLGIAGMRRVKVDPRKSLNYKITNYKDGIRNARNLFTKETLKGGVVTPEQVVDAYINSNRALYDINRRMFLDIDAAKVLGMNEDSIAENMINRGERRAFGFLNEGAFRPYSVSRDVAELFDTRSREIGAPNAFEQAADVLDRIKDVLSETSLRGDVFPSIEQENRKLKEINRNIQTKLNQTERELAKLKENVNLTCEEMLRIMRDGQEYGHTEDYTEQKRLELKKHYSWKDKL